MIMLIVVFTDKINIRGKIITEYSGDFSRQIDRTQMKDSATDSSSCAAEQSHLVMEDVTVFDKVWETGYKKDFVKMYTLNRGQLANFDETHVKKMQQLLQERKGRDLEAWILSTKLSQNFSGISYSVSLFDKLHRFRTNKPIILWSLGFWGPFEVTEAKYNVEVTVAQIHTKFPSGSFTSNETILEKLSASVQCQRKKIFTVHLAQSTLLPSNTWIQIRFQLCGPDTAICSTIKGLYNCDDGLSFEFFDSSHQLPQLNYSVP